MGKLMGDMGARVVKIEPLQGSPERNIGPFKDDKPDPNTSLYFWARNTSKESLTVNLESPKGIGIVKNPIQRAFFKK